MTTNDAVYPQIVASGSKASGTVCGDTVIPRPWPFPLPLPRPPFPWPFPWPQVDKIGRAL